jgi:integrase
LNSTPYLICRDGIYYFRKVCPKDLLPFLGRQEITKSLRTASVHLAKRLALTMATDIENLFEQLRQGLGLLKPRQVDLLASHFYQQQIQPLAKEALEDFEDRTVEQEEWEAFHARTFQQEVKNELKHSSYDAVQPEVDRLIEVNGLLIEKGSAVYKQVCRAILIGLDRVYESAELIVKGDFENPAFNFESADSRVGEIESQSVTLKGASEKYLNEYKREWSDKHYHSQKAKLDHFMAFMGKGDFAKAASCGLGQVSTTDAREYKELLQNTPSNALKKYPDLSVFEVLDAAREADDSLLGTTSINNYIQCVSSLYTWAARELDYQGKNYFKGRTRKVSGKGRRDERNPFSREQLSAFFKSPLFMGCQSLSRCHEYGGKYYKDSAKYWVPLIGFYTGMRLQEILQLYVEDVYQANGLWVLDLNTNHEDKKLKTHQSKRVIPIHGDLIEVGLVEFRNRQEAKESQRLFPDATLSGDGTYSSTFSKWFGRYLNNIGIKTSKTSFHSFRHNIKDFFRSAGVSDELSEHYLGRLTERSGEAYGSGHTTESFAEALIKIKFSDCLDADIFKDSQT